MFHTPEPSTGVRIDTGFATGDVVSVHYDAMLAKLICHAPSRDAALLTMHHALASTDVVGVVSNVDLLGRIVAHPTFRAGGVDTGFIEQHRDELLAPQREPPVEVPAAAALAVLSNEAVATRQAAAATRRSILALGRP